MRSAVRVGQPTAKQYAAFYCQGNAPTHRLYVDKAELQELSTISTTRHVDCQATTSRLTTPATLSGRKNHVDIHPSL